MLFQNEKEMINILAIIGKIIIKYQLDADMLMKYHKFI